MFQVNNNGIRCKFANIEDFDEIQKLYWNLIEQSKDEPSFPGWKKGGASIAGYAHGEY